MSTIYVCVQILMTAYHLHVTTPVLILLVVLCAPVMMDMNLIMMEELVMVCSI